MPDDGATTHVLKTWPQPFQAVWDRQKVAEFRKNDRNFRKGDFLCLVEYDPEGGIAGVLTGREVEAEVTHVLAGPSKFGVPDGYAMLSMRLLRGTDVGGTAWEIG